MLCVSVVGGAVALLQDEEGRGRVPFENVRRCGIGVNLRPRARQRRRGASCLMVLQLFRAFAFVFRALSVFLVRGGLCGSVYSLKALYPGVRFNRIKIDGGAFLGAFLGAFPV